MKLVLGCKMAEKGIRLKEIQRIPYANCYFAGGFVDGHPHDELYLQIAYPSKGKRFTLFLTPDELSDLIKIANAVLFKYRLKRNVRKS